MHTVAEGPHAMGACCRVTGTLFSGREALLGERTCQGSPHGRVGVKERRGGGVTHAEELCAKSPGGETSARMCLWAQAQPAGLQSRPQPEPEALRPRRGVREATSVCE